MDINEFVRRILTKLSAEEKTTYLKHLGVRLSQDPLTCLLSNEDPRGLRYKYEAIKDSLLDFTKSTSDCMKLNAVIRTILEFNYRFINIKSDCVNRDPKLTNASEKSPEKKVIIPTTNVKTKVKKIPSTVTSTISSQEESINTMECEEASTDISVSNYPNSYADLDDDQLSLYRQQFVDKPKNKVVVTQHCTKAVIHEHISVPADHHLPLLVQKGETSQSMKIKVKRKRELELSKKAEASHVNIRYFIKGKDDVFYVRESLTLAQFRCPNGLQYADCPDCRSLIQVMPLQMKAEGTLEPACGVGKLSVMHRTARTSMSQRLKQSLSGFAEPCLISVKLMDVNEPWTDAVIDRLFKEIDSRLSVKF